MVNTINQQILEDKSRECSFMESIFIEIMENLSADLGQPKGDIYKLSIPKSSFNGYSFSYVKYLYSYFISKMFEEKFNLNIYPSTVNAKVVSRGINYIFTFDTNCLVYGLRYSDKKYLSIMKSIVSEYSNKYFQFYNRDRIVINKKIPNTLSKYTIESALRECGFKVDMESTVNQDDDRYLDLKLSFRK